MNFKSNSSDDSTISYSNNSTADEAFFRLDSQGNIRWTTVVDFHLGYDTISKMATYESIVYAGIQGNNQYPWFFTIDSGNGQYLKSSWFSFYTEYFYKDRGRLKTQLIFIEMLIELVTQKYIFG